MVYSCFPVEFPVYYQMGGKNIKTNKFSTNERKLVHKNIAYNLELKIFLTVLKLQP